MNPESELGDLAQQVLSRYRAIGKRIATAESCTGGLIAAALTAIPGSSDVFERGFVTYSNQAKIDMLGVDAGRLERFGAVSAETAAAMARGALEFSKAEVAISVTGVAGPGGGSAQKPVGLVFIGIAGHGAPTRAQECRFADLGRHFIRLESAKTALRLLLA